ncbi:hypothetical protein ACQRUO_14960, partial [Kitasatospora sp. LaBMicrA B282]
PAAPEPAVVPPVGETVALAAAPVGPAAPAAPAAPTAPTAPGKGGGRRGVSWKTLLAVAAVMALGGTVGGLVLSNQLGKHDKSSTTGSSTPAAVPPATTAATTPDAPAAGAAASPSPDSGDASVAAPTDSSGASQSPVSAPTKPGSYTAGLNQVALAIPPFTSFSDAYKIDLAQGTVVPPGTNTKWDLSIADTFQQLNGNSSDDMPKFATTGEDGSDFAVITGASVSPDQCATAISTHPDSDLTFGHVTAGRLLCIRDRTTNAIAIAAIQTANQQNGSVQLTLSTWQPTS